VGDCPRPRACRRADAGASSTRPVAACAHRARA
jgi:hypothetical protein